MNHPSAPDRVIRRDDDIVPRELRACWPIEVPQLYVRGSFPPSGPAIAIVGSTQPDPVARSWAYDAASEAVRLGWIVVSGLARGIDGAAHEGAVSAGGVSVGVVAHGLDVVGAIDRASLTSRMLNLGGSIVSISPAGIHATSERLLLRNQFTSGLADLVLVVQARGRGGTLATARHAVRQRKLVATFAVPEFAKVDDWAGNLLLLDATAPWRDRDLHWQPARRVESPSDLRELFAHFERWSPVDVSDGVQETQGSEQLRLLEERATYDGDE